MAEKLFRKKIKDCQYVLPARKGFELLKNGGKIAKFLGGPMGQMLAASSASPALIADGLRELGEHLASEEFQELVKFLLEGLSVISAGKAMKLIEGDNAELFDHHFAGDIGAMIAVIWWALAENYGGFFDGLPGAASMVAALKAKAERVWAASQISPEATTGASQGSSSTESAT